MGRNFKLLGTTTSLLAVLVSTALGHGLKPSPTPEKVSGFQWKYPFEPESLEPYSAVCEAEQKFSAAEYTLHNLMEAPPKGLGPWAPGLKKFFQGREYPGGWAGWDRHLHDRSILQMEYAELPLKLREWIEQEEKQGGENKGMFGVFNKVDQEDDTVDETTTPEPGDRSQDQNLVVMFAPGAIYGSLPLWIAQGSDCEDDFSDLSKYQTTHADGAVMAWPSHTSPTAAQDKRSISISIRAMKLAQKADWAKSEGSESHQDQMGGKAKDEL